MPSKKKSKTRAKAKSTKKARLRLSKVKMSRKPAKKKSTQKKTASRVTQKRVSKARASSRKKRSSASAATELKREFQNRNRSAAGIPPRQSTDFEGLSRAEQADSESVDELVEEGNVFEAGAVAGVEEADNSDEREVRTHELPEDDVPDEYLDKD
jgi:hypothetical protein